MTKADLARQVNTKPEAIRRLLTVADGNPTVGTVLKIAAALGCHLELMADARPASGRRPAAKAQFARRSR